MQLVEALIGLHGSVQSGYYWLHMSLHITKPTKWHVRLVKTWISLCNRPVWSESSLSSPLIYLLLKNNFQLNFSLVVWHIHRKRGGGNNKVVYWWKKITRYSIGGILSHHCINRMWWHETGSDVMLMLWWSCYLTMVNHDLDMVNLQNFTIQSWNQHKFCKMMFCWQNKDECLKNTLGMVKTLLNRCHKINHIMTIAWPLSFQQNGTTMIQHCFD